MNLWNNIQILTSNFQVNSQINFRHLFPVSLSGLQFDATAGDVQYLTAEAVSSIRYLQ